MHRANDNACKWCMDCILADDVDLQSRRGGSLGRDRVYVVPNSAQLAERFNGSGDIFFENQDTLDAGGIQNLVGVEM